MPIFQDFFSSTRGHKEPKTRDSLQSAGPETLPVKMNLEERMAFRRELLFETVKATLNSQFIESTSYRFKVMRTDRRGHCYVVMFDMSPAFMHSEHGQHANLAGLAGMLTHNAHTRYGLVIGGVYWRVDDTLAAQRSVPAAPVMAAPPAPAHDDIASSIERYERATAEQLAEFEAAWQKDSDIQIGDRTYSSDLAPLGEDPPLK
ncbi:MAG: hypothetical protein JWQ72_2297 [Polaromonas sp.]|nr:hypothetical protein [Polaromonas sp.]